jgi:hypothetical protein
LDLHMLEGHGVRYTEALACASGHVAEEVIRVEVTAEAIIVGAVGA